MSELGKKLGIVVLSLALVCLGGTAGWAITAAEIRSFIDGLPLADFYNENANIKTSVLEEIDAVDETLVFRDEETDETIQAQLNQDAIDNLTTLRDKNSGCVNIGEPDEDDFVINNCDSQTTFYSQLSELITQLESY